MAGTRPNEGTLSPHILLVEDEPLIRALLAEELRSHDLVVVEAANADEAWTYIEAGGAVDLLFSDITMPGNMNGADLVRRVRGTRPDIKTIIMSGNPGPANIKELGSFLPKPYRLQAASELALKILGRDSNP